VCNDVATAHLGAFEGGDGVLILAGTGSMAWAQGPQGTHRVGGFGDLFGDEGSAYWIGRAALATASRQIDGRLPDTGFATELCACVGVPVGGLINWAYGLTDRRAGIAALARDISGLAQGGNDAARGILVQAAQELALAGQTAAAQAGLGAPCPWAIAGGVFADAVVTTTLTGLMGHAAQPCALPPVGGALLDAARRAGWPVTDTWIATLARHLAAEGVA
jgi:N-acetylglucosamine kinase